MDGTPPVDPDRHGGQETSEGDSKPEAPGDLMVVSRARRSNAGNRMATLLAKSAEEEEWGEEWEEAANEEEFVGDDANEQEDYNLDSSSSEDEDDGDDDDAGEKEVRKAERQERIKKRKPATNPFAARLAAAASRKRVKLDVPSTSAQSPAPPVPRPKKKSERASWIPTEEDGPIRTSSRKQTMANKEHTLAKLKEKDQRRDETLAMMKAAEARKAKDEPKPLTQAERLAEAARVERINKKTLHRWEEAEEQRAAERQAKIDALKNRQIEGPFIRFYSGPAIWVDDKIKYTGKDAPKLADLDEKLNKEAPVVDSTNGQFASGDQTDQQTSIPVDQSQTSQPPNVMTTSQTVGPPPTSSKPDVTLSQGLPFSNSVMFAPPENSDSFLFGMEQYSQPPNPSTSVPDLPPNPFLQSSQQGLPPNPFLSTSHSLGDISLTSSLFSQPQVSTLSPQALLQQFQNPPAPLPPPAPPRKKVIRRALRNLLILSAFPDLDAAAPTSSRARSTASLLKERDKAALVQLSTTLFNWSVPEATAYVTTMLNAPKTKKEKEALAKPKKELCAVSNKEARYRDPETGIAYRDSRAFGVLRGVVGGGFVWCGELGCYVGGRAKPMQSRGKGFLGMAPAAGVPRRFLEMEKKAPVKPAPAPAVQTPIEPKAVEAVVGEMVDGGAEPLKENQAPAPAEIVKTEQAATATTT
ncbi:YL1-domain-containing protein [Bimuria novae-zelandiae CBS 107.79]|uniref:YL1-domain-containing protein n=1 Tax=Bimuria novae-zelandiae CBS 107.79 TaxID=1447943 RepID=A0A6A5V1H0_9PLEO|nr:YL1-domain-containing protein [Bimuria novae-zelandiae CBS 107.79]